MILAAALLVPALAACGLAAASPFASSRRSGLPSIATGGATLVLCALVCGSTGERVVGWFSAGSRVAAPRVAFVVDPIGGGLGVFVAALAGRRSCSPGG